MSQFEKPQAVIIAGPNGSGKSTCATLLLSEKTVFMNADQIAQQLTGIASTTADLKAGRILLQRLDELQVEKKDFAVETTLATRKLDERIKRLRQSGYDVHLLFLWLPNSDLAVQRVAARVKSGGHDVPEATIRRRFVSGLSLFFNVYMHLVDTWRLYDNSRIAQPRLIAWGKQGAVDEVIDKEKFAALEREWVELDFGNREAIDQRVKAAVREAIQRNKQMGIALPEWDGEKVKVVPADQLPDDLL